MEIEQLRQLVAVERCGTISAAAEQMNITQPSLSRSIRRLERDLGQELFDRGHNSVRLNAAGELAVSHAKRILADVRLMRDDFDELAKRERTIRIASVAPAPTWRLTALVVERFPGTILGPELMGESQAQEQLLNRDSDIAILRRPMALPTLRSVPLMTEDLYASVPAGHPLAKRASVSFSDLDGEPFLLFKGIGSWMDVVHEHLPSSRLVLQEDRMVFVQMLRTSDLLAFTSDAPENAGGSGADVGRVALPINDADAHATFFLLSYADASGLVGEIVDWVAGQNG
ncbi:MAG: LysR family transcriptional regulator [Coriobacteriales bacterium]|jgi:LysR family cyn operon transcriptional activator